jgi:hypothetical protein
MKKLILTYLLLYFSYTSNAQVYYWYTEPAAGIDSQTGQYPATAAQTHCNLFLEGSTQVGVGQISTFSFRHKCYDPTDSFVQFDITTVRESCPASTGDLSDFDTDGCGCSDPNQTPLFDPSGIINGCQDAQPDTDCPVSGTVYGENGHICTVAGLVGAVHTPVLSFVIPNPNNPSGDSEGPPNCTISRENYQSTTWVFDGPEYGESGNRSDYVTCPADKQEPEETLDPTVPDLDSEDETDPRNPPEEPDPNEPEPETRPNVGGLDDPNYPNDPSEVNEPNVPQEFAPTPEIPDDLEEQFSVSISGDCSVSPSCNGDSKQCAVVYQVYESQCASDAKNKANTEDLIDAIVDRTDRSEDERQAAEALGKVNDDTYVLQQKIDEANEGLDEERQGVLDQLRELAEDDSNVELIGTTLTRPDWFDNVLPSSNSCQTFGYVVNGETHRFPNPQQCTAVEAWTPLLGYFLYLWLLWVAFRTFKDIRTI